MGPGFDRFGLCLANLEDRIEFRPGESDAFSVEVQGDDTIPTDPRRNAASAALGEVLRRSGRAPSGRLRIVKGHPGGSGLGSSGASALGGALAGALSLGLPLGAPTVIDLVLRAAAEFGEVAAAGTAHYDNVVPSYFGAFTFIESLEPLVVHRIEPPGWLRVVVAVPALPLTTRVSRSVLPVSVSLKEASENIGRACALVHGLLTRDAGEIGRNLVDRLAEPSRAPLVPGFAEARSAALAAGAWGVALAGSGPALFAFASAARARHVGQALQRGLHQAGSPSQLYINSVGDGPKPGDWR